MRKVLIAEDDSQLRETLRDSLSAEGFVVRDAHDGRCAIKLLGEERFDAVVTDILMPDSDGLELIREVRKIQPDTRIVAISGGGITIAADFAARLGMSFGADAFLYKPFRRAELVAALARADGNDEVRAPPTAAAKTEPQQKT